MTEVVLAPGDTVGILGGGQLGRMLAMAAARLGLRVRIYDPDPDAPAAQLACGHVCAAWDDADAMARFAQGVQVVTYEFENVPLDTVDRLAARVPVRPGLRSLATGQDRLAEKTLFADLGLAVAPFAPVEGPADLETALATIGVPAILKTRRMGYDGKGQVRIAAPDEAPAAWAAVGAVPSILEGVVAFSAEVSVIAVRGLEGAVVCYDPGENLHEAGILRRTVVPARLAPRLRTEAVLAAGRILNALDHVGVMGVEMFVTPGGLVINEIAPRVHNSGHWTELGCAVDQFEQHMRAVAGWPLGPATRHADVEMENLIGADVERLPELLRDPAARLHLYGKAEVRAGRKMGHVTRLRMPGPHTSGPRATAP
ncbi:MAG: 5-(carboxyamino)imidazole ribonucleotide synthase [Alkalilacustris sp.]